jgi:hypothetical protein
MSVRSEDVWRAFREDGLDVVELGARFDLPREKIRQLLAKEHAKAQLSCSRLGVCRSVHEPPCPMADPTELTLAAQPSGGADGEKR